MLNSGKVALAAKEKNQPSPKILDKIIEVECLAVRSGHGLDAFVASTFIEVYGKCGSLSNTSRVFDTLKVWFRGRLCSRPTLEMEKPTLQLFALMQLEGCEPNAQTS
ncbi:pentatricopeptide repeat-containing protein At5g55740, chloroplastic-like [Selaginella moellendorffii]|uniref:pentatricopeptide repeat-containing protein At5g55740, chloroplastic-like n=1 Tax=Selaginella moellendorffii TaxID=88036 RepID=UPI000D1D07EC|nr:pentatricopeptide repeat-containing protein At5g55740, chloroplastic-like [Selaginella moellendorffii]XP_024519090.1 pentatricopeptide repeat-containing protein At5g55740, chloroplastic-like [Selaginella moellendorffii]|eukprot:XP_024519089.1 pentatricopeptide repeat-containing protein At5g55740, chloroplastic-like [Selaginella moellendorffii]